MDRAHSPKLLAHCPVCHAVYAASEIRMLGEKGETRLFHCTCASCGHAVLAVVLDAGGSLSSVGMVTDLEAREAMKFQDVPVISEDECIATHALLESRSRDMCRRLLDRAA